MDKLTDVVDYFRKVPIAFLVAIISVLALILFLPEQVARSVAVDGFREEYRVFLGPLFLVTTSFFVARLSMLVSRAYAERRGLKARQSVLHRLTPEEKGYLLPYIDGQRTSVCVGIEDGVMSGLAARQIGYRASNMGNRLEGFPFNLQPWAREYLENNRELLLGHVGEPMTPRQKLRLR